MVRLLLAFVLQGIFLCFASAQSFTVDDLMTLSSLSPKKFDNYMNEKGYLSGGKKMQDDAMSFTFLEKIKLRPEDSIVQSRSVGLYKKENAYCFSYHTTSREEYEQGINRLKSSKFFLGESKKTLEDTLFYQKKNLTVHISSDVDNGCRVYSFLLQKKEFPANIHFAEDLLIFDSHEFLVSYFGEENVKKDVYYFTEKSVKKCSVLFGNSDQQAVFVWEDEDNLCKLSYVLISGILPTESTMPYNENISRNKWAFKSGIFSGMSIRDLLRLNGQDFKFYGLNSEFSLMVAPETTGNLDFKKIGIMMTSIDGTGPALLKKSLISAEEAVENRIALHVFYILLSP
ncbi:MAG: hypothetical protein ACXWWC_10455 [Chitinophagaceae bacterium]